MFVFEELEHFILAEYIYWKKGMLSFFPLKMDCFSFVRNDFGVKNERTSELMFRALGGSSLILLNGFWGP